MKSMSTLKVNVILGLWEHNDYFLLISNSSVTLTEKNNAKMCIEEPLIWKHILNEKDKIHYNTIQISENLYIHQLFDNADDFIILYKGNKYNFKKIEFINTFKFYKSNEKPSKLIAIRWYNPWGYIALAEFDDSFNITRILKGNIEEQRKEINDWNYKILSNTNNWRECNFKHYFPHYKQAGLIKKLKNELQY